MGRTTVGLHFAGQGRSCSGVPLGLLEDALENVLLLRVEDEAETGVELGLLSLKGCG